MDDPLKADADADDNPFIAPVVEFENSLTAEIMELDPDEAGDQWWSKFDHNRSLCIFSAENCFRVAIMRLVVSKVFNNLILALIILNTLEMAINCEDYFATDSTGHKIFDVFDYVVNVVFTVELCLRVVALGLYFSPGAYLQYNTYRLDFLVVAFAWLDEAVTGFPNLKALRIVRALRALKSLRFMNQVMAVMDSVEAAIPLLKNVAVLFLFLIALFSIMGTQLLAGTLRTHCVSVSTGLEMINNEYGSKACTDDAYIAYDRGRIPGYTLGQNTNGFKCPAGFACMSADNPNDGYTSFDNIPMACFTIFQVASLEGWTSLSYQASDGLAKSVVLYFLAIIIFFSYFTFQLFTAVMFLTFAKIREQADMVLERDEFAVDRALAEQPTPRKPQAPEGLQIALNWTLQRGVSNLAGAGNQADEAADEMNAEMIADWGKKPDRDEADNGNDVMYEQSEVSPLSYLTNEAAVTDRGAASSSGDGSAADGEGGVDIVKVDPVSPRLSKISSTTPLESPRVVRASCAAADSAVLPPICHRRVSVPVPSNFPTTPVSSPPTGSPSATAHEQSDEVLEQEIQEIPWEAGVMIQKAPTAPLAPTVGGENNENPSSMEQWLGEDCEPSWGPSTRSTNGSFILDPESDIPADNATTKADNADTMSAARSGVGSGASVAPDHSSPNPLRDPVSAKSDTIASCSPAQRGVGFGASVAPDDSSPAIPLRDHLRGCIESDQQRPKNRRSSRFTRAVEEDVRRPSQNVMTVAGQRSRRNSGSMDIANFPCLEEWREEIESDFPSIPGCLWSLWYHADPMISTDSDPPSWVRCDGVPLFDNPVGHLITNWWYMNLINVSILLNVIIMSMSYHKEPGWWTSMLEWAEVGFFCIFFVEMVLKFIGFGGFKWYFTNNSNVFDFCIILVSVPFSFSVVFSYSFPNLTILRLFRLARLLRTFRFLRSLGEIIDVVLQAGKAIANLLVFMTISYIITAIFMMQLMSRKIPEGASRNNFDCFGQSLLTLFVVMSGEDWNSVMYATWEASTMGGICVLLWFFFSNFILLNMFAAIILENMSLSHLEKIQLQVMVYMNDKEKKFIQGNLEKKMEALRRVSMNENAEFVPSWDKVDFQKEEMVMKNWEENQFKGMSRDEREEYMDFLRLRTDEDGEERLDQLSDQYVKHEESPYYDSMNTHTAEAPAEEQMTRQKSQLMTANSWFKNTTTQVTQAVAAASTSTDKASLRNNAMMTAPVRDLKLRVLNAKKTQNPQEITAAKEALELEIKTQAVIAMLLTVSD